MTDMIIYPPGSLPSTALNRNDMMGSWNVPWSTLPMWRKNRDVTITYAPSTTSESSHGPTVFTSDVAYRPRTSPSAQLSHVTGTERLASGTSATFNWRGDGWLFWCTSRWEVIGAGKSGEVDWCVTIFSKTLFTPRGLDILVKGGSKAQQEAVVADLVRTIQAGGEGLADIAGIAKEGQDVPMAE